MLGIDIYYTIYSNSHIVNIAQTSPESPDQWPCMTSNMQTEIKSTLTTAISAMKEINCNDVYVQFSAHMSAWNMRWF